MAKRLATLIDTRRCFGCHTCAVACKSKNDLPDGVWRNRVVTVRGSQMDTLSGVIPHIEMSLVTAARQHCKDPACVLVRPTGAPFEREKDGIVAVDYGKYIGCGTFIQVCPYKGVRTRTTAPMQYSSGFQVGDLAVQAQQPMTVSKCTFCSHRFERGEQPACIDVCPARARFFGDLNDPESDVARIVQERDSFTLQPEKGTNPNVIFVK